MKKKRENWNNQFDKTNNSVVDAVDKFVKRSGEKDPKQVKVIGFVSSGEFHNDSVKNPLSDDWMSEDENVPQELLDDLRKNGWEGANGNVCFPENYQPLPVKGEDGNVYLAMNDTTIGTPSGMGYLMEGMRLLNEK